MRFTHTRRRGQIAFITVFAIMALTLLIALLLNTSRITSRKMDTQNTADAVAIAAAMEEARALNSITVINHEIGELNAVDVLVYSYGGVELEEGTGIRLKTSGPVTALKFAQQFHGFVPPEGRKIPAISHSRSGAAIGDSRKKLKEILECAHAIHAAGGVLVMEPILSSYRSVGQRIVKAAVAIEKKVAQEWEVLDALERKAEQLLKGIKHVFNPTYIPKLHDYQMETVRVTPKLMEANAEHLAKTMGMTGTLYPNTKNGKPRLELPVVREKLAKSGPTLEHSQMVRATTPWVQYWRPPAIQFGQAVLPLSGFARHYFNATNKFTLLLSLWQQEDEVYDTRLYILKDLKIDGKDKGQEEWTTKEGSALADERFCLLGFAHQPAPVVVGYPIFRQTQPDGISAVAQAMVYNANPQTNPRKAKWQPRVAWDTLAWVNDVPEYEFGLDFKNYDKVKEQPRMQPNWQAKLVPVTRLADATDSQTGELNAILGRLKTDGSLANTK
jgi:hypothetical protein